MTCEIRLSSSQTLDAPICESTVRELIGYILGYYQSLFVARQPIYHDGQSQFLFSVLRDGYGLTEREPRQGATVVDLQVEQFEPTPDDKLDHKTFSDPHAWRLMTQRFIDLLEEH